jgi:hypothetical protein
MPQFRVRVVASYPPTEPTGGPFDTSHLFATEATLTQSQEVRRRLYDWVSEGSGRTMTTDHEINPPRLTLEVVYDDVEAPTKWDAEVDGRSMFREEVAADGLPTAESVVAHAEQAPPN